MKTDFDLFSLFVLLFVISSVLILAILAGKKSDVKRAERMVREKASALGKESALKLMRDLIGQEWMEAEPLHEKLVQGGASMSYVEFCDFIMDLVDRGIVMCHNTVNERSAGGTLIVCSFRLPPSDDRP